MRLLNAIRALAHTAYARRCRCKAVVLANAATEHSALARQLLANGGGRRHLRSVPRYPAGRYLAQERRAHVAEQVLLASIVGLAVAGMWVGATWSAWQ